MNVLMQMNEHADGRIGDHVAGVLGAAGCGADGGTTSGTAWMEGPVGPGEEGGVRPGDPVLMSPDHRVDALLSLYFQSAKFRRYRAETRRNYAQDIALLLTFLWSRDRSWTDAVDRDLEDYEHWRRFAPENPERIGGSKWDRKPAQRGIRLRTGPATADRPPRQPRPVRLRHGRRCRGARLPGMWAGHQRGRPDPGGPALGPGPAARPA